MWVSAGLIVQILALVRRHASAAKPPDVGLADVVDADKSQNAGVSRHGHC